MGLAEIEVEQVKAIREKGNMVAQPVRPAPMRTSRGYVDEIREKGILTPITTLIFAAWSVVCVGIGAWVF